MAGLWIYLLGLLLCFDYTVANHLSRNRTLTRDQLMRRRTTLSGIPNGNNAAPQMGRGPLSGGRAGNPPGGGLTDPRTGATGLSQRDIDRVILTPVQDGAVRSLRNMLSTRRGRGNPRLIGFLIPRRDGRTQLRLMRGAERFLRNGRGDNSGNRVNVNELPFNIRTIVAAARRANLLPSRNGTRGFQQSRRIATVGGFAGQGGGPNAQPNADSADSGGGETIKQRTVNIEVNVQSPDAPATGATPQGQNPNAANPGMMNPALMNNQQSRFMNNMGPGAGFNPMFNEIQQPGMNSRNGFNGFNRPGPVNNNNNRNNNRPADDSSSSSKSSNSGGGNINIGLGIGVGSSSPVVPPKPASTRTPASPQFGGGRGTMNGAQNVQPTPPDPFQQQRGINAFDQSGFPGMPQTGFPPNDQSGFPSNTQISFPSNPQTGFPPSNQFQPNANNPQAPTLQRFDQQPPAISGSMPASNSMPWNTFQSNAGNFGQDTGSLANTNTLINSNQNVFANNMQRSNVNGMQILRNIPQQANGIAQTRFNMMQPPQQFNNLASNQNFANSPVLTSQTSPGGIGSAAGAGGFDPTLQNTNLPNSGNAFQQGSFASEPTIGEPMIIDNGGRTTVVVDNITFTGLLPPGPPVLKTQVINGKGSVHINPLVSSERAANSFGRNFPPQLHFTNPNDINSINQNILMNANSNQLFQNQNILGLPGTQGTKSPVEPQMNQDTSFGTPSIFVNTSGLINLTQSAGNANVAWASNNSTNLVSNATNQPQMIDISIPLNTNSMSAPQSNIPVDTLAVNGGQVSSVDMLPTVSTEAPGLLNMVTSHSVGLDPFGSNSIPGVHASSHIPPILMTSTLPSLNLQSLSTTVSPQILAHDPQLHVVENIPQNPAEVPQLIRNVTQSASQTPNNAFQTQILTSSNVQNPAMAFNNPQQLLEMQRQQQILQMHRLALLKRREEQLNTLRKQLLHMELKGNQRQPVQRNPLTAETTKDLRILKNIKPGAKAPQTTATSAVAFMNVDSLRSLIEEVLHGFFKKQKLNPTGLPQPTVSQSIPTSIDVVNSNVLGPAQTLTKQLNLLQLNMSAVQLSTSPPGMPLTTRFNSLFTSTVSPIVTVNNGAVPSVLPTEPMPPVVTDPSATPVTDPHPVPVTDPNPVPVTDPTAAYVTDVTGPSVTTVTTGGPSLVPVTEPSVVLVTDPNTHVVPDPSIHHPADVPVIAVTGVPVTDRLPTGVFSTTLPPSTTHLSSSSSLPVIMDSVGNSVGQPSLSGQKRNIFPGGIAVHPELSMLQMAHVRNVPQTSPSDLRWGLNLRHRGVQLPGRARGIVSSIPEMVGGGLSSTNARVITHQHRPLDRSNFNLQLNRRMQDIAMTPNVNVPVRQPGGVPVFPMM